MSKPAARDFMRALRLTTSVSVRTVMGERSRRTVPRSTSMQRSETKTGTTSRTWRAAPCQDHPREHGPVRCVL